MTLIEIIAATSATLTVAVAAMFVLITCVDVKEPQPSYVPLDDLLEEDKTC